MDMQGLFRFAHIRTKGFTKQERSLIFSALKKSCLLNLMLLPNFALDVIYVTDKIAPGYPLLVCVGLVPRLR